MTLEAVLLEDARAAYVIARRDVFDMPGWTPKASLSHWQELCVTRLDAAEDAISVYRTGAHRLVKS